MTRLIIVSVIWAFSFSLIGEYLAGQVDSYLAVLLRVIIATAFFLPFLRFKPLNMANSAQLIAIGAIQIGIMYLFFYHSFLFLTVPEVLMLTVITPLYVSLFGELIEYRSLSFKWIIPVSLSIAGALVIRYQSLSDNFWLGALLVQGANICFALGQVLYKRKPFTNIKPHQEFALFFIGASVVASISFLLFGDVTKTPSTINQWLVLLWLGSIASGLGYYLWNTGAKLVNLTQLATMNNLVIPIGLIANFWLWDSQVNYLIFFIGSTLIVLGILTARLPRFSVIRKSKQL